MNFIILCSICSVVLSQERFFITTLLYKILIFLYKNKLYSTCEVPTRTFKIVSPFNIGPHNMLPSLNVRTEINACMKYPCFSTDKSPNNFTNKSN